jgi:flagellar biosynthesis protein FlhF
MGGDAVILHTRQVDKRRVWPWSPRLQEVEITAGLGMNVRPGRSAGRAAEINGLEHEETRRSKIADNKATALESRPTELAPPPPLLDATSRPRNTVTPPKWSPNDVIRDDAPLPPRRPSSKASTIESTKPLDRLTGPQAQTIAAKARRESAAAPAARSVSAPTSDGQHVHERLDQLQRLILELGRERHHTTLHDVPSELFHLYTSLIDADMDDGLARDLVCKARQHATASQLRQKQAMHTLLAGLIERDLKIAGPIAPTRGQRNVVALVGPTGVGKTTTLAKLAANFRLRDGVKLGLVTVDTYRIAAVEQLKTYAELIDLPMKVVASPDEMRRALQELSALDLVLIDTAGRSPQDEPKVHELQQILQAAQADEVHLVLSLTASMKALVSAAASFRPAGVTSLIVTKLDEVPGMGALFNLASQIATPISYVTTGQDVPEDIEPAQAARLARLVLGQERVKDAVFVGV